MGKLSFFFYWFSLFSCLACNHTIPARRMPVLKVSHSGTIKNMPLEKYVACVLAGEVHSSWPFEALKAQAIAARTFAVLRMKERKNQPYHIRNSVMDQVCQKHNVEVFTKAARESAGLVLTINNQLAETSFHSTCGGKTTASKNVWGRSYPHLTGTLCQYCYKSPTFHWTSIFNRSELEKRFSQKIAKIRVLSRFKDGRIEKLALQGNTNLVLTGHKFRMTLGPMKIKSTLIKDIKLTASKVIVTGQGFGHGVGMCQYGALGMAKAGKNFKEILSHYYPGTKINKIY
jgi:stage II sporulation protein D